MDLDPSTLRPLTANPEDPTRLGVWRVGTLTYSLGGVVALFGWLLWGDVAYSMRDRIVPPVMQLLFKKFGASDALTGFLFSSLPCLLNVFVAPVLGYRSDRLRTRWGRRIPFLFGSMPFVVISVTGLACCAPLGTWLHHTLGMFSPGLLPATLVFAGLFWTLFEIACLTANFVFGGLINDVVPHPVVGRCFGVLRAGGLLVAIFFNFFFFGKSEANYPWLFACVGVVYGVGFTLMCLRVKEGEYPPPAEPVSGRGTIPSIRAYLHDGFGHPFFVWFFVANTVGSLVALPFNTYSVFYARSLSLDQDAFGKCLALTYVCSLVLSYPLGWLADRFHPLRVSMLGQLVYAAAMGYGFFFARNAVTFAVALVAHGVVSGSLWTVGSSLGQRLLPPAKFAEIGSAGGIMINLVGIVAAPSVGALLDSTHHEYRYTFLIGLNFSVLTFLCMVVLYRKFVALGGPDNYVAPE